MFTLRARLSDDAKRQAVYRLLRTLADRIDEGKRSFDQFQVSLRLTSDVGDKLVNLVKATGISPTVREV